MAGSLPVVLASDQSSIPVSATLAAAIPAGTNNIGDVDVLSSALPTGASTAANQTTIIGHVDGIETLLGTIDADTGTLAGAVSGTEMQVDVVSMPAVDTELPAAAALADNTANPTVPAVGSHLMGYNRVNDDWDRVTVSRTNADGMASHAAGNLVVQARGIWYNGTTWDRARGDATDGLLVNLGANNDITGTVTANLSATDNAVLDNIDADTSAIQTAVEIMDDWDESDRAKVNLIVGQAGITGNAGNVAANTPRITEASAGTATLSNVSGSASSVQLIAASTSRMGLTIQNDSSASLYVKFGTTASTSDYTVKIPANGYYEMPRPVYTGRLDGIWSSATGAARITQLT